MKVNHSERPKVDYHQTNDRPEDYIKQTGKQNQKKLEDEMVEPA